MEQGRLLPALYFWLYEPGKLDTYSPERLTYQEQLALKGYKGEDIEENDLTEIIRQPKHPGIHYTDNTAKFIGLYLSNPDIFKGDFLDKFQRSNLLTKYLLAKFDPEVIPDLKKAIEKENCTYPLFLPFLKHLMITELREEEMNNALEELTDFNLANAGIEHLVLLKDLEKALIKTKYNYKTSAELIEDVFNNFSNAIQSLLKRRKGKEPFKIENEYDVQDLLYLILRSIFGNVIKEEPTPFHGGSSKRVDLVLREEGILIEVKMIKKHDTNANKYTKELKEDIESYDVYPWLKTLYCFIYDPYHKTTDDKNFYDLNGVRKKGSHQFEVKVFISR